MRTRRSEKSELEDLVTLWHVGGAKPCHGPAVKVPPGFLSVQESVLPQGCEAPDGSKLAAGDPLVCGTCGESVAAGLASHLALSRERYRA